MPKAANSSASPGASGRLERVALADLHPHPANPNVMSPELITTLARNIEREGRYPPLIARPHPELPDEWQVLDGHNRWKALRQLGQTEAWVFPWACDDATALRLLATLNRLEGQDVPALRAQLLQELSDLLPIDQLAALLPEDAAAISEARAFTELDTATLLAELEAAHDRIQTTGPRVVTFAIDRADEATIEEAIRRVTPTLAGRNRRGRALAQICRHYLEDRHG